jgi:hypothetical protein
MSSNGLHVGKFNDFAMLAWPGGSVSATMRRKLP